MRAERIAGIMQSNSQNDAAGIPSLLENAMTGLVSREDHIGTLRTHNQIGTVLQDLTSKKIQEKFKFCRI